jgi:hypothetical protein
MSAPGLEYARVYRISCPDGHFYYGSTSARYLNDRIRAHKRDALKPGNAKNRLYTKVKQVGWDNVTVEEITTLEAPTRLDLRLRENEYIRPHLSDPLCLNHNLAFATEEEKRQRRRECQQRWNERKKAELNTVVSCHCGLTHTAGRTGQHLTSKAHELALASQAKDTHSNTAPDSATSSQPPMPQGPLPEPPTALPAHSS